MKIKNLGLLIKGSFLFGLLLLLTTGVQSQNIEEDILNTKHNLSALPPTKPLPTILPSTSGQEQRNIYTPETTEICVFCHTPHGASLKAAQELRAPLWNRNLSTQNYIMYDQVWSKSFEGKPNTNPIRPTGFSRLCLSCHDGTIALGSVINKPGSGGYNAAAFNMLFPTGQSPATGSGTIPAGGGPLTGNTRYLGTNLTNDHAISFIFDSALAAIDGELVNPGSPPSKINDPTPLAPQGGYQAGAKRAEGGTPGVFNSVQCTSCHNPHAVTYPKFLRAPIFNRASDPGNPGLNHPTQQILCLFCHDKPGFPTSSPGGNKITSTHNESLAVHNPYPQGNPYDFDGEHSVAEYACRSCHDPHTSQGSKRLHREGVDNANQDAIENTCYLCHSPQGTALPAGANTGFDEAKGQANGALVKSAPDIWSQFAKDRQGNGNPGLDGGTGTGSAMDLRRSLGHEPVFTSRPREGVQLGSDNLSPAYFGGPYSEPPGNKSDPQNAPRVPDTSHVECTDCHNMHQAERKNRFKGMPGITIENQIVAESVESATVHREPYTYEVCLRCHGNTFNNIVPERLAVATGTGKMVQARGDNYGSVAPGINPGLGVNASGSNKRKEFDPDSTPFYSVGLPNFNTAFHPIATAGRNQSGVLNNTNQGGQLLGLLSRENTIQCVDCHNTDLFGTFNGTPGTGGGNQPVSKMNIGSGLPFGFNIPDFPGPITFDDTQGLAFRRTTDLSTSILDINVLNDPAKPQGPHGSKYKRILRGNYDTTIGTATTRPLGGCGSIGVTAPCVQVYNPNNFSLCYNCHDEKAFTTPCFGSLAGIFCSPDPSSRLTNFYRENTPVSNSPLLIANNLHYLHLMGRTNARCIECHWNIHSNVEAGNTYYIDLPGLEANNPGHSNSTHLVNFQPNIGASPIPGSNCVPPGETAARPCWGNPQAMVGTPNANEFIAGRKGPGCNLQCHGFVMNVNYEAHSVIGGMK